MHQGFSEVDELLKKEGICVAWTDKLIKDSGVARSEAYDEIVRNLWKKSKGKGRGIVLK